MAGKRLYELITERGGKPSDYSDVVYGTVISAKPLKVQLSNNMVLTDDFIILGKHIGKFKIKGKVTKHEHDEVKGNIELAIDNSLESGDKVTMIREHGGQQFDLFERIVEDGLGY